MNDRKLERSLEALRITMGGTAFVAGLDKFFDLLTDWNQYLSPVAKRNLPMRPRNFMRLVGVIEMAVGGLILARKTRVGGFLACGWLLGIAANLVSSGEYYDIAARDVNMAVGALVMAALTEVRDARLAETEERERLLRAA
jgi:uncharacterized membrane protein YphA (DoxX/SURF4 family)